MTIKPRIQDAYDDALVAAQRAVTLAASGNLAEAMETWLLCRQLTYEPYRKYIEAAVRFPSDDSTREARRYIAKQSLAYMRDRESRLCD